MTTPAVTFTNCLKAVAELLFSYSTCLIIEFTVPQITIYSLMLAVYLNGKWTDSFIELFYFN